MLRAHLVSQNVCALFLYFGKQHVKIASHMEHTAVMGIYEPSPVKLDSR